MRYAFYRNDTLMGVWNTEREGTALYLLGLLRYTDPNNTWTMEKWGGG